MVGFSKAHADFLLSYLTDGDKVTCQLDFPNYTYLTPFQSRIAGIMDERQRVMI